MDLPLIEPDVDDFHSAWHWLRDHPFFFYANSSGNPRMDGEPGFEKALDIMVVRVDPKTGRIEDDDRNTATRVWLEAGPWHTSDQHNERFTGLPSHDIRLDCEGATFEEAIKFLARLVFRHEGSYPEHRLCSHCYCTRPSGPTDENAEWFCSAECEACGPVGFRTEPVDGSTHRRYVSPHEYFDCDHWTEP
jgi:hypothetical protein